MSAVRSDLSLSAARLRIRLTYLWRHHRLPRLAAPARFTEHVQRRKLENRDPRLPALTDKLAVKAFVADRLGAEWIIPTLWSGTELPEQPGWPVPFVVKTRHGCRQIAFARDVDVLDWAGLRAATGRWMARSYGGWLDEWAYAAIPRGLLVEPFVGAAGMLPVDYKFYVFGGRVAFVQVHVDREHCHRWIVLDREWRRASGCGSGDDPLPPTALTAMIAAAERLGDGFDFVRVDLYQPGDRPLFGELSFYPGSGLDRFDPPGLDHMMGTLWSEQSSP